MLEISLSEVFSQKFDVALQKLVVVIVLLSFDGSLTCLQIEFLIVDATPPRCFNRDHQSISFKIHHSLTLDLWVFCIFSIPLKPSLQNALLFSDVIDFSVKGVREAKSGFAVDFDVNLLHDIVNLIDILTSHLFIEQLSYFNSFVCLFKHSVLELLNYFVNEVPLMAAVANSSELFDDLIIIFFDPITINKSLIFLTLFLFFLQLFFEMAIPLFLSIGFKECLALFFEFSFNLSLENLFLVLNTTLWSLF